MERYKIIFAYDGTLFVGSQRQVQSRTVQSVLESALTKLGWHGKSILLAGRTDTGVHASGQVAAVDINWNHTAEDLRNALFVSQVVNGYSFDFTPLSLPGVCSAHTRSFT
jgi:tRNA pseudouridine38-40 synthase